MNKTKKYFKTDKTVIYESIFYWKREWLRYHHQ